MANKDDKNKKPARVKTSSLLTQFFADTKGSELLTKSEERRLLYLARLGDAEASQRLVFCNLRFVISIVKRFFKSKYLRGQSKPETLFLDCIGAGIMGIYKAIEKFDVSRNSKFSTYAGWWIRHHVSMEVVFDRRATQPVKTLSDIPKVSRRIVPEEQVPELNENYYASDAPIGSDFEHKEILTKLTELLDSGLLTSKQKQILIYYYGLKNKKPLTYKALADKMKLTTERVRQIQNEALRILYFEMQSQKFGKLYIEGLMEKDEELD